jgi:hypothetical protein
MTDATPTPNRPQLWHCISFEYFYGLQKAEDAYRGALDQPLNFR